MHIIRLRGPWELEPVKRFVPQTDGSYRPTADDLPPSARAKMPADWCETMGHDFLGVVRYSRNFNRPTNLEEHERVWLVVEPPQSCGRVRVSGEFLGNVRFGGAAGRFDITRLLKEHNSADIDVEHPALDDHGNVPDDGSLDVPGGLVGEVRLEIEVLFNH
ncbi:MAG: hypothetical protein L0228_11150 [Planctomycetes bacterium]|nr:hypothetical protein [Planctomycetota bacterium]